MKIQLVADSSANIYPGDPLGVAYAPLKIVTTEKEYVDDDALDVRQMLTELKAYKGKSSTACPSVQDWKNTFGDADMVLGVAITSGLSGCYNAGVVAAEEYMEEHPGAKVFLLDSRSTGPEMQLILEKYAELADAGCDFEEIRDKVQEYHRHTHLLFALSSLDNLAKNGRVNPLVAKAAGLLGIRAVGTTTAEGTLAPKHKCRGEMRSMVQMLEMMEAGGFTGGKVRITHSCAPKVADAFCRMVLKKWPDSDVSIACNRGLCCFYAEEGSLLAAFEGKAGIL